MDRARRYEGVVGTGTSWQVAHENYLDVAVRWTRGAVPPKAVDPLAPSTPETFRTSIGKFNEIEDSTLLVHVLQPVKLGLDASISVRELDDWLAQPDRVRRALARASQRRDQLPLFAGLWGDLADVLPEDEANAPDDWADLLRNRLGLSHIFPRTSSGTAIIVFRYRADRVPRGKKVRPFTIPTVLDMRPFPAFCPVPSGSDFGRTVCLTPGADTGPASRELLHPPVHFQQEDLFRHGTVWTTPPRIATVRGRHLKRLRTDYDRPDYASDTDSDLL